MTYRAMENPPGWRLFRSGWVECDNCICAWHCYAEEEGHAAAGGVSVMSTAAPGAAANWFGADDYGELWDVKGWRGGVGMWMVAARGIGIVAMTVWWGNEGSWAKRFFFFFPWWRPHFR